MLFRFEEYQSRFGGFTLTADMTLGATGLFENGGTQLWRVRTCHHAEIPEAGTATAIRASGYLTSPGAPTPATVIGTAPAPFRLEDGDKLVASLNGGADEEAVFHGARVREGNRLGQRPANRERPKGHQ